MPSNSVSSSASQPHSSASSSSAASSSPSSPSANNNNISRPLSSPPSPPPPPFTPATVINCLLLGDAAAEKTKLVHAYLEQMFPGQHGSADHCLFFEHDLAVTVRGVPVTVKLWDLTGQECYDKLRQLAYRQIAFDVFLVCFSLVDPDSFDSVNTLWAPELKWNCAQKPFLLVGTHSDLRTDKKTYEQLTALGRMPITRLAGKQLAKRLKAVKYVECSVQRKQGLVELFEAAFVVGLRHKQRRQAKSGSQRNGANGNGKNEGRGMELQRINNKNNNNNICSIQ